jgi:UDP-N-acetylglucosamine--N-acetylmuramyl-(pentapeptide) pyrophosphoryl-undecaprenol N-acetylglucosamine transferase
VTTSARAEREHGAGSADGAPAPVRVVLTGGGTGGHIYPALAIAAELRGAEAVGYLGTERGLEARVVPAAGIPFFAVPATGVLGKSPTAMVRGALAATAGVTRSSRILRQLRPDVVVGTGGYVTGPVGLAAALLGISLFVLEENARPGITNRMLARFARHVAVPWAEAAAGFPASVRTKVVVTGNPVRREVVSADRAAARTAFQLDPEAPVLLVVGGSQGAEAINTAIVALVRDRAVWPRGASLVWATGPRYYDAIVARLSPLPPWLHILPYLNDMPQAYAAADVVLARAGAMTVAEITARGVPAVLVPSPNVTGDHQTANARVLAERGAAVLLAEGRLRDLGQEVTALLADPERREAMAVASRALGRPDAAATLAALVVRDGVRQRAGSPGVAKT